MEIFGEEKLDSQYGIFYDLPFSDYCNVKSLNISTLCEGNVSMAHLKAKIDGITKKDSGDMALGRAMHARCLEPDVFAKNFIVTHGCERKLKSGKRKGDACGLAARYFDGFAGIWTCGKHTAEDDAQPEANCLTEDEAERVEAAAQALSAHPVCKLLKRQGGYEATMRCLIDGIDCKGRIDKESTLPSGKKVIIDLKKVQVGRCGDEFVKKAAMEYLYDAKAAWYCDMAKIVTGEEHDFVWIFIEDNAPYSINTKQMDEIDYFIGQAKYQRIFNDYKKCLETNIWPGISDKITVGITPEWERKKYGFK